MSRVIIHRSNGKHTSFVLPDRFKTPGRRILAILDRPPFFLAKCIVCTQHRRFGLVWRTLEEGEYLQAEYSPQQVAAQFDKHQPHCILVYTGRFYTREGKALPQRPGGYRWPELEALGVDFSHGPILVEHWDEEGWPIGRRVESASEASCVEPEGRT